ncbi:MAG: ABC transporter permease [Anaerolineae bacterium]
MGRFLRVAWRNVWRNRRRTVIAMLAMSLALTLILVFDGMMEGMTNAMYGKSVQLEGGNVLVHAAGYRAKVNQLPLLPIPQDAANAAVQFSENQLEVVAAAQRIETSGLLSSREGSYPTVFIGIQPEREGRISPVAENVIAGRYLKPDDEDVILIGQGMAEDLEVGVGDRITLSGRATHEQMRQRTMTVIGIYDLGADELEDAYISLAEAQTLFDLRDQVTEVGVYLEEVGEEAPVVADLRAALPGYEVDAWDTLDPSLTDAMSVDRQVLAIMNVVILAIAGVGIFNLMLMVVVERTREIGLIAAMGLKRREIVTLFLLEGSFLGLLSALIGSVLGGIINALGARVGMPMPGDVNELGSELYALMGDRIYFANDVNILAVRSLMVLGVAALASLYPAWRAASQEPTEALHHI